MKHNLPRGLRNNNPGNIRINPDHFKGELTPSKDSAFKQFETISYGYRAMFKILLNYRNRYKLQTLREWMSRWAPENENNTSSYVYSVANIAGISPDGLIDVSNKELMCKIVAGMSLVENGRPANLDEINKGWDLL